MENNNKTCFDGEKREKMSRWKEKREEKREEKQSAISSLSGASKTERSLKSGHRFCIFVSVRVSIYIYIETEELTKH